MWNLASSCFAGCARLKNGSAIVKQPHTASECSDDETSSVVGRGEGLECPICWEFFNMVENVPYVLWCGHTLCKNCILGLQWAIVKVPTLPIQLPLFISCPWCNLLSLRLVYDGNVRFPRKNYFLLWIIESINGDRVKTHSAFRGDHHHHHHLLQQSPWPIKDNLTVGSQVRHGNLQRGRHVPQSHPEPSSVSNDYADNHHLNMERLHSSVLKSLVFVVHLTSKFPLVLIFLLIILYAVPASAAVLALYILVTVLIAFPSFLMLYFAYPSLDWLVREITA